LIPQGGLLDGFPRVLCILEVDFDLRLVAEVKANFRLVALPGLAQKEGASGGLRGVVETLLATNPQALPPLSKSRSLF